ncbi:MAG: hypothetical protein U5K51_12835 [Flavobacteriaceae bacterium]|nr:hypothetical protein [Flavobacteriaceae bacterium]
MHRQKFTVAIKDKNPDHLSKLPLAMVTYILVAILLAMHPATPFVLHLPDGRTTCIDTMFNRCPNSDVYETACAGYCR